jgi:hypothetical protein
MKEYFVPVTIVFLLDLSDLTFVKSDRLDTTVISFDTYKTLFIGLHSNDVLGNITGCTIIKLHGPTFSIVIYCL